MKFVIGTVEKFEEHGFNTTKFRKSLDGTKAIIHLEYAEILIPNVMDNVYFDVYIAPSLGLLELLNSLEWKNQEQI